MRFDILAVDGSNAIHRAHHTAKALTTTVDGHEIPIGAVYGFLRIVIALYEKYAAPGCRVVIGWEGGPDLVRHTWFPGYRRRDRNLDIERQVTLLKERILPVLGWNQTHSPGWECDDVMASVASAFGWSGVFRPSPQKVGILSGDHDLHQLVRDTVHVINPTTRPDLDDGQTWRPRDVRRHWTVGPELVPDVKALCGDKSDCIPGAKGIGEEWARRLISYYGSLENTIAAARSCLDTFGDGTVFVRSKAMTVKNSAEQLMTFKRVCTLNPEVDLVFGPRQGSTKGTIELLKTFRFASLQTPSALGIIETIGGRG